MSSQEKFWDKTSKSYDDGFDPKDPGYIKYMAFTRKHLKPDFRVLDFGCGTGTIPIDLANCVDSILGIDISSGMVDRATEKAKQKKLTNLEFRHIPIFSDELEKGSYDAVLCFNVLHLVDDVPGTIQRVEELLKPGGLLISKTPCLAETNLIVKGFIGLLSKLRIFPSVRSFTKKELRGLIEAGSLDIVGSETIKGEINDLLVVARKRRE